MEIHYRRADQPLGVDYVCHTLEGGFTLEESVKHLLDPTWVHWVVEDKQPTKVRFAGTFECVA